MQKKQDVGAMSKSMLTVMIFMMLSKVTGFLRETVLASHFGRNAITDAYKAAFDVPCLILSVVVSALSATLIPVFEEQQRRPDGQPTRFIRNLYTVGLILSALIVGLTLIFLEPIVHLMLPAADAQTQNLTMQLARIMMPMGLFVFLARMTGSYLQANFCFSIPAVAPLFLNLCIIASIYVSAGKDISLVAAGSLLGMVLNFVIQIPSARRRGLKYRPVIDFRESGLRQVAVLMIPVLVSCAFDQIYLTFDRAVASGVAGDITALDYGNRISTMVSSVLLTSIATVIYPSLVKYVDSHDEFSDTLCFGINLNLLIALPASVALILLRQPIARLVYQRGAFTAEDTLVTSGTLACYCVGLLGIGLRELCNRAFYAFKDTKLPTIVGVSIVILNIILNYLFYPIWGASGIAIATSVSSLGSGITLLILLYIRKKAVDMRRLLSCLAKSGISTLTMGVALFVMMRILRPELLQGNAFRLSVLCIMGAGMIVYLLMLILLRTKEVFDACALIKKKFHK